MKKEGGFPEFIVRRAQIKLDSLLSQVCLTCIKACAKFRIQVAIEICHGEMVGVMRS